MCKNPKYLCAVACFLCLFIVVFSGCGEDKPEAPKKKIVKKIGQKDDGPKKVSKPIVAKKIDKKDTEPSSKVTKEIPLEKKGPDAAKDEPVKKDIEQMAETAKEIATPVAKKIGKDVTKPIAEKPIVEKPEAISKKISAKEKKLPEADAKPEVEKAPIAKPEKPGEIKTDEKPVDSDVKKTEENKKSLGVEDDIRKDDSDKEKKEKSEVEKMLASVSGDPKKDKDKYDSTGRLDPFMPLIKEEEQREEKPVIKKKDRPVRPKTPLEKVDLSQLKLVGIVRAESGNKALVQQADGKGYIITKGTYVGIHSGKVVDILRDRVIVEEDQEDWQGNISKQKRELKLQKAPGEDYYEM